jgi:hypothetical protein
MYEDLKHLAKDYLKARQHFLVQSAKHTELAGNDNIIGRIGEMIAIKYLESVGRKANKCLSKVNKGYDLECNGNKISVKLITAENKNGKTTQLKQPWTELILITLGNSYEVERLGHITLDQFMKSAYSTSNFPIANRKMLEDNELFQVYGTLQKGNDVKDYL